ncbi:hypothetical protein HELRODRAFT_171326 [Helobdella robusta]|uniref:Uncharacterized protein n=1 Tax=Helobdella robusta TaxID=6412 RepID=T1F443_HELRO|nr:hypothetical protein HELRODRAFT_171326 [Helobdella robusta]ESO05668.1 hypothetical protein HELRODRAFT_171326 [Helobdella robusta]
MKTIKSTLSKAVDGIRNDVETFNREDSAAMLSLKKRARMRQIPHARMMKGTWGDILATNADGEIKEADGLGALVTVSKPVFGQKDQCITTTAKFKIQQHRKTMKENIF